MKYFLILVASVFITTHLSGQAKTRKLSTSINHPSINVYAPFISADATAIVYISDAADDGQLTPYYSVRETGDWREPVVLPKSVYTRMNYIRGYSLSADGNRLYLTTIKSPGVGGYDLWYSDWKGNTWGEPVNIGAPINTKGHEACASVSTDGNSLYFMRCTKIDQTKAENCKIFVAKKKGNGQWDEPVELPSSINNGNAQTPRIMADGETLIYSSDKGKAGKGGMDLYTTKKTSGDWSQPVALDFVNTPQDDQFISVAGLGRYLLRDSPGPRKNELVEYLIPDNLRPKGAMKVTGKVTDMNGKATPAYLSLLDLNGNKRVYSGRVAGDGTFLMYVIEGTKYELSIDPEQNNFTYYSRIFDLTTDKIPQIEKVSAVLKPLDKGDELSLSGLVFRPNSGELDLAASANEFKRFQRIVAANPTFKYELQVMMSGYREDSVQSDPDLTEIVIDSVQTQVEAIDADGNLFRKDSTMVRTTYNNDRTTKQAEAILKALGEKGVNTNNFTTMVNAIPSSEPKKLVVKAVVR